MKTSSAYQKVFIILALCIVFILSSANSSDDPDKPIELSNKKNNSTYFNDDFTLFRPKRFSKLLVAQWGTKWCLDQITDPDSDADVGLFFQTDGCCKELVNCTSSQKKILLKNLPEKADELKEETFRSCACDELFNICLQNVHTITCKAKKVGKYYFNNLAKKCRDVNLKKVDNLKFNM